MIRKLSVHNFTVFREATFEPSRGLNVVIGANGTGKSHLLKLAYAVARVRAEANGRTAGAPISTKEDWQRALAAKLVGVFRPQSLGRLVSRQRGRNRCEVAVEFVDGAMLRFSFATNSKAEVKLDGAPPAASEAGAVFLPTQEALSTHRGFAEAYRRRELDFDETYYDLALALEAPPLRGRPPKEVTEMSERLEELIGGRVQHEASRGFSFVSKQEGRGAVEMPLVAEGFRKLGMVSHLIRNGSLGATHLLFWDEPETNLNPRMLHPLAEVLIDLAARGIQVFLATHSLFFLRELELAFRRNDRGVAPRYVALALEDDGTVRLDQGASSDDIEPIAMLEADLDQSDRYLEVVE